jgi:hypothetical protein
LGYNTKGIDGDFGKGSKKALSDFRLNSRLENDSKWDVKTQKLLFKNSGK